MCFEHLARYMEEPTEANRQRMVNRYFPNRPVDRSPTQINRERKDEDRKLARKRLEEDKAIILKRRAEDESRHREREKQRRRVRRSQVDEDEMLRCMREHRGRRMEFVPNLVLDM